MSHFTVMCVTKDEDQLDDLLEPYNENTQVEPYWEEESLSWERGYYSGEDFRAENPDLPHLSPEASDEELVAWINANCSEDGEHYRVREGQIERETTYNPDSKWDYWRVGGRWAGRLKLKPGAEGTLAPLGWEWTFNEEDREAAAQITGVDQARKGDIDIDGMRDEAQAKAEAEWATYAALVAEHGEVVPWSTIREKHGNDIDAAREEYQGQPIVKAAKDAGLTGFMSSLEDMFGGHDEASYVKSARDHALAGYAFLSEETGWVEPGRMGWWGMSSDTTESRTAYNAKVAELVDNLPDDAVITFVDCHI